MCVHVLPSIGSMKKRPRSPPSRPAAEAASSLERLLGGTSIADFFAAHWEQRLLHVSGAHLRLPSWRQLPSWENLLSLLDVAARAPQCDVLCLKDQHPTTAYQSPAAAYLDGASIIVNHAEVASAGVASLCTDLRLYFPHAFGNLYATPPAGRAVEAHSDDRDVLVLQLEGSKEWQLYAPPPVPFPESDEQVGKHGRPVPASAVAPSCASTVTLVAGDVLYLPRGHVHEAATNDAAPSLHLTIALPSHDWSWASLATAAAAAGRIPRCATDRDSAALHRELRAREVSHLGDAVGEHLWLWRRAVPPCLVCEGAASADDAATARARALAAAVEQELDISSLGESDTAGEGMLKAAERDRDNWPNNFDTCLRTE